MVYLLTTTDLASDFPRVANCNGWHTEFDHNLRRWLIDRHEWRGVLPVIALDMASIRESAADLPCTAHHLALRTFLHEVGHAVPFYDLGGDIRREPTPAQLSAAADSFAKFAARPDDTPVPWAHHGLWFVRAVLHLHYRAIVAGFDIPGDAPCAGFGYALSPAWVYAEALADEPQRMRSATFRQIKNTEPPAAFVELFNNNLANYFHYNPPEKENELCQLS